MSEGTIAIIIIAITVLVIYMWYASIIQRRNQVLEALSSIDVQLRKRFDLIPNILTMVQKFMSHEQAIFNEITALRTQAEASYNPANAAEVK